MKATIYISGVIGKETELKDVIRQFKSYEDPDEVQVVIHSEGGNVEKGDAIYNYLKTLDLTTPVTTVTDKAYSISAKIFTAGSTRIIEDIDDAAMIHFAWANNVSGKAEKLELIAETLREIEEEFTSYYAELLEIDSETAASLLNEETFFSGAEAVEMGFATELKEATKAVAIYKSEINLKQKDMSKKIKKSKGKLLLEAMAAFVGLEEKDEAIEEVVALMLQDSNGDEIDFADLESGDVPKVGDKGTIDGVNAEGSFVIPSMEEATVVFEDGVITEIKPKEDDENATPAEDIEAKKAAEENAEEVNAEIVKEIIVWELEVVNTSFAVGDIVQVKDWEGVERSIGATEFQTSGGRRIVTDAAGEIVTIKGSEEVEEEEVELDAETEARLTEIKDAIETSFQAKLDEKEETIKRLNKKIGSKEINAQEEASGANNTRTKAGEKKSFAQILSGAK